MSWTLGPTAEEEELGPSRGSEDEGRGMSDSARWASLRFDLYETGVAWEFEPEGIAPEVIVETLYSFLDQWLATFNATSVIHPDDVKALHLLSGGWPRPREGSSARELQHLQGMD
jgi:hypothetical protein